MWGDLCKKWSDSVKMYVFKNLTNIQFSVKFVYYECKTSSISRDR